VEVRAARAEEIPLLREIERRAGAMFAGIGLDVVAEEEPPPAEVLAAHVEAGTAWVAAEDGLPVGYAIASLVDGEGHLDQVSVLPEHGLRGIGRALVDGSARGPPSGPPRGDPDHLTRRALERPSVGARGPAAGGTSSAARSGCSPPPSEARGERRPAASSAER
jgi:GNAT superfamily N-acetyltransferase